MTVVAVFGVKHSPGATTLATALAALLAEQYPLVIEADPTGGDLAARTGHPLDPGLLSLAAGGRRGVSAELVEAHTQRLTNGALALLAPTSPAHAHAALTTLAPALVTVLRDRHWPTIIDAGRWDERSPAHDLIRAADMAFALFRPTVEGVEHLRNRLSAMNSASVTAVAIGENPYGPTEIQDALGGTPVHVVAHDPRAALLVGAGAPIDRWLRRSTYLRSVASLADAIASHNSRIAVSWR